jgi:hypothetical protein
MTLFWILWAFCALMSLVPLYFFFTGLADGSITSKNIGLWGMIIVVVCAILVSTVWLRETHFGLARLILIFAAVPGLLVILYFAIVLTSGNKTRWN